MIQRIQSVFLLVAFIACSLTFFTPFWVFTNADPAATYEVNLFAVSYVAGEKLLLNIGTLPVIVLAAVSAVLSVVSLFMFKNRPKQIKFNNINIFVNIFFVAAIAIWIPYMLKQVMTTATSEFKPGLVFPLITIVALVFANVYTRKDEHLVKSADRLR